MYAISGWTVLESSSFLLRVSSALATPLGSGFLVVSGSTLLFGGWPPSAFFFYFECHQSLSAPFLIADLGAAACDLLPD